MAAEWRQGTLGTMLTLIYMNRICNLLMCITYDKIARYPACYDGIAIKLRTLIICIVHVLIFQNISKSKVRSGSGASDEWYFIEYLYI